MATAADGKALPSGPSSLADMLAWPDEVVDTLRSDDEKMDNLRANFKAGCTIRTLYSGYDNPSVAFHSLRRCLRQHCGEVGACIVVHSADIMEGRRKVLIGWEASTRAAHVFGDILDRLRPEIRQEVLRMMPCYDSIRKCTDSGKQRSMVLAAAAKYKQISELLDKEGPSLFSQSTEAECFLHEGRCRCCTFDSPQAKPGMLTWVVAGSNCQAWSQRGLQLGVAHPSFLVFLVFAQELKQMRPDIWLHEITPNFPHALFDHILGAAYSITVYQGLCPTLLGHPIRRPRQFLVGHRRATVQSTGTSEEFKQLFARKTVVSGAAYFVAPRSEALWGRCGASSVEPTGLPFACSLSPSHCSPPYCRCVGPSWPSHVACVLAATVLSWYRASDFDHPAFLGDAILAIKYLCMCAVIDRSCPSGDALPREPRYLSGAHHDDEAGAEAQDRVRCAGGRHQIRRPLAPRQAHVLGYHLERGLRHGFRRLCVRLGDQPGLLQ